MESNELDCICCCREKCKTFVEENAIIKKALTSIIGSLKESQNIKIDFISKKCTRDKNGKVENYIPKFTINRIEDMYSGELAFQVYIDSNPLKIPYNAIKKMWPDTDNQITFELDLAIVRNEDERGNKKFVLEPMYNFINK